MQPIQELAREARADRVVLRSLEVAGNRIAETIRNRKQYALTREKRLQARANRVAIYHFHSDYVRRGYMARLPKNATMLYMAMLPLCEPATKQLKGIGWPRLEEVLGIRHFRLVPMLNELEWWCIVSCRPMRHALCGSYKTYLYNPVQWVPVDAVPHGQSWHERQQEKDRIRKRRR